MLKYKGYIGQVAYDAKAQLLYGFVIILQDTITFEGATMTELENAFKTSIDNFIQCMQTKNNQK
jgi:predicted HicB family RNase H-like nuclease